MSQFGVFSLADVYREADRGRAAQREEDKYQRGLQQEQSLSDIYSQQKAIDPATLDQGRPYQPAVPELNTGTGGDGSYSMPPTGEYSPAVAEQAGRVPNHAYNALQKLEHSANTKREMAQKLSSRGFGAQAERIAKEADAIDEKIINAKILMQQSGGGGLQHPFDLEDASGRLYKGYTNKAGQQVVQDATGKVVDPNQIPGLKITKGNTYINVADAYGRTIVQAAPRAGGGSPSYAAPAQENIEQVGKEYKESLEPVVPVMDRLDKLIAPIDKAGGKIPGVGFANNTKIGQLANDKGVGGDIYRDSKALANAILKIRSGLAVTAQEEARVLIEVGANPLASADAFLKQFRKLQDAVDNMHNRVSSQYGNAASIYDDRQKAKGGYLVSKSPWKVRREQESASGNMPSGWSVRTK